MIEIPPAAGPPRGEAHINAKLTEALVREIRRLHGEGYGYGRIAKAMGVSRSAIERVVRRRSWAHVS